MLLVLSFEFSRLPPARGQDFAVEGFVPLCLCSFVPSLVGAFAPLRLPCSGTNSQTTNEQQAGNGPEVGDQRSEGNEQATTKNLNSALNTRYPAAAGEASTCPGMKEEIREKIGPILLTHRCRDAILRTRKGESDGGESRTTRSGDSGLGGPKRVFAYLSRGHGPSTGSSFERLIPAGAGHSHRFLEGGQLCVRV